MTAPPISNHPRIPQIVGYEPVEPMGENGAIVYRARALQTGELVAMKVYDKGSSPSPSVDDATLVGLAHPNLCRVYEVGYVNDRRFLALEFVECETLRARLGLGPLVDTEAARVARIIASALEFARNAGLKAVDLSPGNVLLTNENVPRLFIEPGSSRVPSGSVAPEEVVGERSWRTLVWCEELEEARAATDVYRVGAILYEMLTGRPPFPDVTDIRERPPTPPRRLNKGVGRKLEAVCMRCLEKSPDRRYASLGDLKNALAVTPAGPERVNWNRTFLWSYAVLLMASCFWALDGSRRYMTDYGGSYVDWGAFLGLFKVMAPLPVLGLVLTYFFGDVNRKLGVRLYFGLWTVWVAVLFPRSDLGAVGWDVAIAVAIPAIPLAVMAGQSWLVGTLRGHLRG